MNLYQTTLREPVAFVGVGLHTGAHVRMRILPAPPESGLRFRLNDAVEFPATINYVVDTARATVLGCDGHRVSTVEHVLSALVGVGISNAVIAVDGPEIPVEDGSALAFVQAFDTVGIIEQPAPRRFFAPRTPLLMAAGEKLVAVFPAPYLRVRMTIDFAAPVGVQFLDVDVHGDASTYRREIAPNRTFGFAHEVEALRARGLAAGGSLDNAVVFGEAGPLVPLRAVNEPVRHKVLDLIGDFALLGAQPQCEIVAIKSGHALHARAVRALVDAMEPVASVAG